MYLDYVLDGYTFTLELELNSYTTTGYIHVKSNINPEAYSETFTWMFADETLNDRMEEIRHEIAEEFEWFAINYYQK